MVAPSAFARRLSTMMQAMARPPGMMTDLYAGFLRAMNTALAFAAGAAFLTAVLVSIFVTRRIVAPIQAMRRASARIADGRYRERVPATSEDELGLLAVQFNRMAETLERTEEMRRDLIADVAHELRTPLASITGYIEAMLDAVIAPEPEALPPCGVIDNPALRPVADEAREKLHNVIRGLRAEVAGFPLPNIV